jgi:phage terminase Nu1 subunit (DNA packaging protein)
MAKLVDCALHLDMQERRFRELAAAGIFKEAKLKGSGYDLDVCRVSYIRHLREQAAGRAGDKLNLSDERALLARDQRERIRLNIDKETGKLVSIEAVGLEVERQYGMVRERLLGIPGKVADSLANRSRAEIEQRLEAEVAEALNELHVPDGPIPSEEEADEVPASAETVTETELDRME